jgi:hypothetical protein
MRTRELLIALAAGSGAIFALHHILGADLPRAVPSAALAADREPPPGPAADAAPAPEDGAGEREDSDPPPRDTGYSGTSEARLGRVPGFRPAPAAGAPCPPAAPAVPEETEEDLVRRLSTARTQQQFLPVLDRLARRLTPRDPDDEGPRPPRDPDPRRMGSALSKALAASSDPVARQNLIFHIAIELPAEEAFPRLRSLDPAGGGGDSEDALCALAFRGDPAAMQEFAALAVLPAPVDPRRLVDLDEHRRLAAAGERELLRAWRCIEALDGQGYFRSWDGFPRGRSAAPGGDEVAAVLLPAWLSRYDGHPGSDDMAWRLSRIALRRGDRQEALRWASRSLTLPDQDMAPAAASLLVSIAELSPLEGSSGIFLPDPWEPDRNRGLLTYVRIRRIAAERGFPEALAEAERISLVEPGLDVSRAFRARWAEPPPRGLESGAAPLPRSDPLLSIEGERVEDLPVVNPATSYNTSTWFCEAAEDPDDPDSRAAARLRPSPEPVRLPLRRLAFQFRCWSTMEELEWRSTCEPSADGRAGLDYRRGAIFYRERDVLFPVYAFDTGRFSGLPSGWALDDRESEERWLYSSLSLPWASAAFDRIRDGSPSSTVADRAAFSAGLARVRGAGDRNLWRWKDSLLRSGAESFEACARDYPSSPLARDAAAAAAYWRRVRPDLWEAGP